MKLYICENCKTFNLFKDECGECGSSSLVDSHSDNLSHMLKKYNEDSIPETLQDALGIVLKFAGDEHLDKFKASPTKWCVLGGGVFDGMKIRNGFGLWVKESPLSVWFAVRGVYHADDKSAIILKSLWCLLNDEEYNLTADVEYYAKYWKKMGCDVKKDCGFE